MNINNAEGKYGSGKFIDWAYLEFTRPEIGMFRVGKFPVSWGHGLTFNKISPGFEGAEWTRNWGPVTTTILYSKFIDYVVYRQTYPEIYNHDYDFVGMRIAYTPTEAHLVELFGGYLHYHDYDIGFVSLAYTGNINDMFDIEAEGGYVFGRNDVGSNDPFGYNFYLDASYYNDTIRMGVAFLLLSAQNDKHQFNRPTFNYSTIMGRSSSAFQWGNILGNTLDNIILCSPNLYNYIYKSYSDTYRIIEFMENLVSVKLYFEITPTEKLTIHTAVIWARALEEWGVDSNYYHDIIPAGHSYPYYPATTSKDLGWEIDFGFSYKIMEGLTYTFSASVLLTGDAWDYDADGVSGAPYDRKNWGEIWSVVNELRYEF